MSHGRFISHKKVIAQLKKVTVIIYEKMMTSDTEEKTIFLMCVLITLKLCAVRMRNAIFGVIDIVFLSEQPQVKCITAG